jgi:cyclophilin family peptidyl-prolyl cis-trans isomerase
VLRAWLAVAIVTGLAGCGSSSTSPSSTSTAAAGSTTSTAAGGGSGTTSAPGSASPAGCRAVPVPAPKGPQHLPPPNVKLDPSRTYTVTVVTNCGTFAFDLAVKQSPKTSASIDYLVGRGFYNGLTFHRVAAGFVIQGGDPLGNGSGGPGYSVVEAPPAGTQYVRGVVAMAKTETDPPGASGSQFFVVTGPNVGLPPDYAVAGKVVSGIGVVERIGSLPTSPPGDGMPTPSVVMSKVTVSSR